MISTSAIRASSKADGASVETLQAFILYKSLTLGCCILASILMNCGGLNGQGRSVVMAVRLSSDREDTMVRNDL